MKTRRGTQSRRLGWAWALLAAFAAPAQAQIALDWSRNYELPEAFDGDCATDALAVLSDGRIVASMHTNFPVGVSRFVQYSTGGALAWSRNWGPASSTTYPVALVDAADRSYFVGASTGLLNPGVSIVSVELNGDLRWSALVPALLTAGAEVHAAFTDSGALLLATTELAGVGPTLWAGFSPQGAPLFTQRVDLDLLAFERVRGAAALGGDLVAVGDVGARAFTARLGANGQVLWLRESAGAAGLGAEGHALDVDGAGRVATAGIASTWTGSKDVLVRVFDPNGALLRSEQFDIGATVDARVGAVRYASDGALWVAGWKRELLANRFFALRIAPNGGPPERLDWIARSGAPSRVHLEPGAAGQVWAVTHFFTPAPLFEQRAAVLQLTAELGAGINARTTFGDGIEMRDVAATALFRGERLIVGGRAHQYSPLLFIEPLAWVAQYDVRASPEGYCSAQTNSAGCAPSLTFSGLPSATRTEGFVVRVDRVLPQRTGLFFYGANGSANLPWLGGTRCIAVPLRRTPVLDSGGVAAQPCSGEFALDFQQFAAGLAGGAPAPELLSVGATIRVQLFSRDPQAASGVNLSSALRYVVLP
jgi:hypothetical protein